MSNRPFGKADRFPIRGTRAEAPGEEAREEPLLINPVIEGPAEHLQVDRTGVIFPKTDRGDACIKILGLNLHGLPDARQRIYADVRRRMALLVSDLARPEESAPDLLEQLLAQRDGDGEFTAVVRVAIVDATRELAVLDLFDN